MKERPVIFNSEMVRAILDGRKTQTRRVMKVQPKPSETRPGDFWFSSKKLESMVHVSDFTPGNSPIADCHLFFQEHCCPFGQAGDRLWVRETWADVNHDGHPAIAYRADVGLRVIGEDDGEEEDPNLEKYWFAQWYADLISGAEGNWRPSIHMPRWASRITLEITGVRVERLNDISDGDAIREGCSAADMKSGDCVADVFARLWASIYGAESWRANPWVWVIEFKHVSAREVERG
ncbi:hypothetical protein IHE77_13955 [Serratia ureilytica]|uniref:hypothetical protein n=1 Tax=Serratia ureilytica TaxID=300181 RepID=UPI001F4D1B87|nr:hypothetical protein [Serratia ureilytica]UNE41987.1 hypothetical protein IHE77_13955 [Serratia ureilytica]